MSAFVLEDGPLPVLRCLPLTGIPGLAHGFSTRRGPGEAPFDLGPAEASPEEAGRRLSFLRACGVAAKPLVLRQVHAAGVVRAAEVPEDAIPEADAAVWVRADGRALAPAVRTADCVPVLLAERSGRAAAAVHAGWRGTAAGIAGAAVRALAAQGCPPEHLIAALGPAIGGCCYEVGPEVLKALGIEAAGRARLDLQARLRDDLRTAGVPSAAIHTAPWCTRCRADLFFSFRREREGAGRLMAVIGPSA